ncbi:reverse transcriptase domain-containing protein [uncultured Delftia sp.]|uniref:reverse transcriptase domain-containing protein n=1 Tax=uncultured Delftia sp. TaxID=191464 RepID=UPI0025964376|nr:reverse transcriptase domain-containing protein [uncultured Delftia sp.]
MNLELRLTKTIISECEKWIEKYHKYHNSLNVKYQRSKDLLHIVPEKEIKNPECWTVDRRHNPFYVKRNAKAIAKSIAKKIEANTYKPNSPYINRIKKNGGGYRYVSVYQIPDNAVSLLIYSDLMSKNRHRFSSYSYAYRNDRNAHYAIQDISIELSKHSRSFIAEFDFSDFFGSIDHEYILSKIKKDGFLVSDLEENVIKAFLKNNAKGIPQGTSLSLFLANFVCWNLDKNLEKIGLTFARYADDTVILSQSYEKICQAYNEVDNFSKLSGVPVNRRKSLGINLLTLPEVTRNEISSKTSFDFLGYSVGIDRISAKLSTVKKIKKEISYLLYKNLIQPIAKTPINATKYPANNRDHALLVAMSEIRRYLYGGVLSRRLWLYINGDIDYMPFKGVLSCYPLINDKKQLAELDGWLISVIYRAIKKREDILISKGYLLRVKGFPFDVERSKIVDSFRKVRIKRRNLLEIPSFNLFYKAVERGMIEVGIDRVIDVESSRSDSY